jgi:GTP-binding protein
MSDHWENVTDNVEALLDMVIACASLKFLKELHKCWHLLFSAFTGRIAIGRLERGVLEVAFMEMAL